MGTEGGWGGGTRRNARAAKFPWNLSPRSRTTANPAFCARDARRRELLFQRTPPLPPSLEERRGRKEGNASLSSHTSVPSLPNRCYAITRSVRNIVQQLATCVYALYERLNAKIQLLYLYRGSLFHARKEREGRRIFNISRYYSTVIHSRPITLTYYLSLVARFHDVTYLT